MNSSKPALTRIQMVDNLKKRGLAFNDEEKALKVLERINYQKLMAYRFKFLQDNQHYITGTTFEDIYSLYKFDKQLKSIIMEIIESIELSLRTQIAYELGHKYGIHCYLDSNIFKDPFHYAKFLGKLSPKLHKFNKNKHEMVKHHHDRYEDFLPIYKVIELTTFGEVSNLFKNLLDDDQELIVKTYYRSLSHKITTINLSSWFKTITDIRNICAHHEKLHSKIFEISSVRNNDWKDSSNRVVTTKKGKKELFSIFGIFLVLKYTCQDKSVFNSCLDKLEVLFASYYNVVEAHSDTSFPSNWKDKLTI